jgi:hypothetical protein
MSDSNRKQAFFPQGARCLYNALGTAPGFQLRIERCTFFFLPGVPHEMRAMLASRCCWPWYACKARPLFRDAVVSTSVCLRALWARGCHLWAFPEIKLGWAKFLRSRSNLLNSSDAA